MTDEEMKNVAVDEIEAAGYRFAARARQAGITDEESVVMFTAVMGAMYQRVLGVMASASPAELEQSEAIAQERIADAARLLELH